MQKIILSILVVAGTFDSKASATALGSHHLRAEIAQVYSEVEAIPARLVKLHLSMMEEGQCMKLEEQLEVVDAFSWKVDHYTTLHVIPCALWAHSQTWKVYAEFNEPREDGHGMFRRLHLPAFDIEGKLTASDMIYDWIWIESKKSLAQAFFYNGRSDCGTIHEYVWDESTFEFKLKGARVKKKCDGDSSPWPEVGIPQVRSYL